MGGLSWLIKENLTMTKGVGNLLYSVKKGCIYQPSTQVVPTSYLVPTLYLHVNDISLIWMKILASFRGNIPFFSSQTLEIIILVTTYIFI